MAIELVRNSDRFGCSNHSWEELLLLAQENGWTPQDAPGEPWERYYFSSDGYTISDRDAETLAQALEESLNKPQELGHDFIQSFIDFCQKRGFTIE